MADVWRAFRYLVAAVLLKWSYDVGNDRSPTVTECYADIAGAYLRHLEILRGRHR